MVREWTYKQSSTSSTNHIGNANYMSQIGCLANNCSVVVWGLHNIHILTQTSDQEGPWLTTMSETTVVDFKLQLNCISMQTEGDKD